MTNSRFSLFGIPIDRVNQEDLASIISDLVKNNDQHQLCFITFNDLIKAQFSKDLKLSFTQSSLNIPLSQSISFAARFLKKERVSILNPFTFIIRTLAILEKTQKSIYILGSKKKNILKSESNLRASFPGIQIVGRYSGTFKSKEERDVLLAIKKSSPTLLLVGKGKKKNNQWIYKNRKSLPIGLSLWGNSCFEIFSGKKRKPEDKSKMISFFTNILKLLLPWHLVKVIIFMVLLIIQKIKIMLRKE